MTGVQNGQARSKRLYLHPYAVLKSAPHHTEALYKETNKNFDEMKKSVMDLSYQLGRLRGNRIMPLSEILIAELGRVPEDVQNILLSLKDVWIKSL
ncbi:MAG: hypothetical protein DYG83_06095 [Candidatus Brocadia sp. AMX2]|nr:MAG: hypothetical protein EDM70_04510 [Candidatus Brocadia sp. AMX2]KXK32986.1 MAG: hypothetical protein UZ01_00408 [Candidatus Brocadia sinica]MBC6932178.1 hypothetical protein [Candidatus Brocadia sp.]MBL1169447.1 hypothetical protein [Candidatus Brocadia sp. AMX1]MCE7866389.1 hypothetical protein [Candidatus Brocadia sp. AMX2]